MKEFINNQSKRAGDNSATIKIYLAGDSTVEDVAEELGNHQGWGQQLPQFFSSEVNVINKAKGGRSTKSFIDEGRLLELEHALSKDDYLFIQFGHNDQKLEDPTRGTEPWGMYQTNLTLYIETAQKQGAKPILITPVSRRFFADGELVRTLGEYPNAMKELAKKLEVPLIDLLEKSRELYTELGEEKTKQLFAWYQRTGETTPPDNTHFSEYGALKIAELVVEGIDELGLDLSDYIVR
ncbi:rhamnogalacturonan acetylesterase [Bacillus suaedae]|uniref:Rhamnogalacturonan acetylesterase n=1 Tax=Halalkalibacter suaedae TaxID=2822140 RepID=A0A940WYP8_9BACI|nr:rhamnogalacturonan acetylesterase [Bacillus suaedae]MBP3950946.1 rhamnogalacturonan acetylesterase [Bacillus suaedae]